MLEWEERRGRHEPGTAPPPSLEPDPLNDERAASEEKHMAPLSLGIPALPLAESMMFDQGLTPLPVSPVNEDNYSII